FDGNQFASAALQQGAAYAIVDDPGLAGLPRHILVPNVLTTLQDLARHHRRQFDIPFIGITGSNGKTTTKELVAGVLAMRYRVHFTQGNLNN
ncbi:MAG TPA: Mur ligase family protein, partial [Saprospiraceae bacterium]|nr:Mur ligase family protein [Saprospiraceae bacterium]